MGELKLQIEEKIIYKIDNLTKKGSIDLVYFNVVFTNKGIILDYLHRSFRTWILRIKPYKELDYDGFTAESIRSRSDENIYISYDSIKSLKFSNRTFIKNAYFEIETTTSEDKVRLFSRQDVDFSEIHKMLESLMHEKVSLNRKR